MIYGLYFLIPIVAVLIAMGGIGQVSTWILGPSTGLLVSAHNGNLPPVLQKTNDYGVPVNLLILQAILVSCFSFLFAVIPGINKAYWDILALMTLAYGTMYLIMYMSAIKLRIKRPDIKREFKIPGGIAGIVIVAGLGFITMLFIMAVTMLPPSELHISDVYRYVALMAGGLAGCIIIPQIIFYLKKDSWRIKDTTE
ncbi:MAG: amino acid permease [Methanogenium sp.]|nr:amino acid permease [Methanogenium sp.]